jgi:hypothetical protein
MLDLVTLLRSLDEGPHITAASRAVNLRVGERTGGGSGFPRPKRQKDSAIQERLC